MKTKLRGFLNDLNMSIREREKLWMNPRLLVEQLENKPSIEMEKTMGAAGLGKGKDGIWTC